MPGAPPTIEDRACRELRVAHAAPRDHPDERGVGSSNERFGVCKPDVRNHDLAGMEPAGRDDEPDLPRVEGDRQRGLDGRPCNFPRRGVDTRRQVDRHDGEPAGIDSLDHGGGSRARGAVETGAEQGIDDDVAPFDDVGLHRLAARLAKDAGGDPPVPSVRPATANDSEPTSCRERPHRLTRNCRPGALHQLGRRTPDIRDTPPRQRAISAAV